MTIQFKLTNAHICKNNECILQSFIIINNLQYDVILGIPFLLKIQHFQVTHEGLQIKINNIDVFFKFLQPPRKSMLEGILNLIFYKENQTLNLKREIRLLSISQKIQSPSFQHYLEQFSKHLQQTCCSEIPSAFWHRKNHQVSLPYILNWIKRISPPKFDQVKWILVC